MKSIGDRPLSLAAHLRAAVDLLLDEAGTQYRWADYASCNCGLLARCITGNSVHEIRWTASHLASLTAAKSFARVGWTVLAESFCPQTGAPMYLIFQQLLAAGLVTEDFEHLEYLKHPDLISPAWLAERDHYADRKNAAAYLQKWAETIEAFHAAKPAEQIIEVKVGELVEAK